MCYYLTINYRTDKYSRLFRDGPLYKTNLSVKRTSRIGPCLSLLPLFDSLWDAHHSRVAIKSRGPGIFPGY